MSSSTALVGPVGVVSFHGGPDWQARESVPSVNYDAPADTRDPRWTACVDHHVACDCREAELSEQINELRAELRGVTEAAKEICAGHATRAYETGQAGDAREVGCMCTGCQIIRRTGILSTIDEGSPWFRDRVHVARSRQATPGSGGSYRVGRLRLIPRDGDRWEVRNDQLHVLLADGAWSTEWQVRYSARSAHSWDDALRLAQSDPLGGHVEAREFDEVPF